MANLSIDQCPNGLSLSHEIGIIAKVVLESTADGKVCSDRLKMPDCFPSLGTPSRFSAIFIHPVDGNPPQSVGTYFPLKNLNYTSLHL